MIHEEFIKQGEMLSQLSPEQKDRKIQVAGIQLALKGLRAEILEKQTRAQKLRDELEKIQKSCDHRCPHVTESPNPKGRVSNLTCPHCFICGEMLHEEA